MIELIAVVAIVGGIFLWAVSIYNRLVRNRNLVGEGWSGIETQLKRRSNLIPNLVEAVKGYMGQERGVLEKVTEMRSRTGQAGTPAERGKAEGLLGQALANLFAVAEAYPDLKSNQNFMDLHTARRDRGRNPAVAPLLQRHGAEPEHSDRVVPQQCRRQHVWLSAGGVLRDRGRGGPRGAPG
jgi:hypothetical protein